LFCLLIVLFCVLMCCSVYCLCVNVTVLLPPGVNPTAANKYTYLSLYFLPICTLVMAVQEAHKKYCRLFGYGSNPHAYFISLTA
jgi:hypothetical protein